MKEKSIFSLAVTVVAAALLTTACSSRKESKVSNAKREYISTKQNMPGDSTVYGLACDGCNDTILVFLPWTGGDPDTFNILSASKGHRVFGRPMIGDKLAVVVNSADSTVADIVIDLEELKGSWCYMVQPRLRERAGMSRAMQQQLMSEESDSMFRKLMQPREYGFEIKSEQIARPIGMTYTRTSDEESPVEFPTLKRYREWHVFNGRLVLHETRRDSLGQQTITCSDTADLVLLQRDTLVLRFADGVQGYYRREKEEEGRGK